KAGSNTAVPAVSTRPMMLVSARSPTASARNRFDGDVRGEHVEADAHQLLRAPLGGSAGQPGPGEPPDHDDARHRSMPLSSPNRARPPTRPPPPRADRYPGPRCLSGYA